MRSIFQGGSDSLEEIMILKAITVLFLLHFDSCPSEAIIIWLINVRSCICENIWLKEVGSFLGKGQWFVLIKLQDDFSKKGLRHLQF